MDSSFMAFRALSGRCSAASANPNPGSLACGVKQWQTTRLLRYTFPMPRKAGTFQVNRILCGDALLLIPTLANRSVALALSSPPYAMQRKRQYGGVPEKDYPSWMCRVMAALRPKLTSDGS